MTARMIQRRPARYRSRYCFTAFTSLLHRFSQPANLRGVVVCVVGVDAEPVFGGVAAGLGVRAGARPVGVGHLVEELAGGGAGAAQGVERGPDGALVVAEAHGVVLLVVALYLRVVLGQELPEADGAVHLAVGEVLDDLARAPLAGEGVGRKGLLVEPFEAPDDLVVAGPVLLDERLSFFVRHRTP